MTQIHELQISQIRFPKQRSEGLTQKTQRGERGKRSSGQQKLGLSLPLRPLRRLREESMAKTGLYGQISLAGSQRGDNSGKRVEILNSHGLHGLLEFPSPNPCNPRNLRLNSGSGAKAARKTLVSGWFGLTGIGMGTARMGQSRGQKNVQK